MSSRLPIHGVFTIALALLAALPAAAQPYRRGNPGMMKQQAPQTYKGTVVTATASGAGGQMQISVESKTLYVMIGQNTDVIVTGTAEPEYLKPGVEVEFVAEVAKGGVVNDKVDHLTLVSISADRPSGLLPPDAASTPKKGGKDDQAKPADAGGDAPAAKGRGNQDAGPPLGGDTKTGKTGRSHSGAPQFPGTFTVRGKLRMYKAGKITVAVTHGPLVKADLADNATIDVDLSDVRVAQRDDAVTVKGNQVRPGMIAAESVTIELANPLTGKKKSKSAKTPPAKSKAKGGDAADAPAGGN